VRLWRKTPGRYRKGKAWELDAEQEGRDRSPDCGFSPQNPIVKKRYAAQSAINGAWRLHPADSRPFSQAVDAAERRAR